MKMFSYIKQTVLLLIFCSTTMVINAEEAEVYVSNNPYGSGVAVRWIGASAYYPEGVEIYRNTSGGEWTKITNTPLMPNKTVPTGIQLTEEGRGFFNVYAELTHQEFIAEFAAVFTVIHSAKEFNLALAMNIAYVDATAQVGESYQYKIEALLNGKVVELGITESITCQPFEPLPAPDSIVVERKREKIDLYWKKDEPTHFTYSVFIQRDGREWQPYKEPYASSSLSNDGKPHLSIEASPDTAYTIKICAHDYFGKQTQFTEDLTIDVQDFTPPEEPSVSVKVDSKKMAVSIAWSANTDEDFSHYNIYRTIDPNDFSAPRINNVDLSITDTTYTDYPELAGSYYYVVEAVDLAGNVGRSLFLNGTVYDIRAPKNPANLTISVDTGLLVLSWDANTEVDLKGYRVYRSVSDDNNEDNKYVIAHQGILHTPYYEESMPENVRNPFAFVVRAVDSSLNVSKASNIVIGQLPDVIPPVAPFIKTSYERDNNLVIEWMPNVESDLAAYNIYKRTKGDTVAFAKLNYSPIPIYLNSYRDKSAERGQFYEYYIEAIDMSKLVSEPSNTINARLENLPLSGNIMIDKYRINARNELTLKWALDSLVNEPVVGSSIHKSFNGRRSMQLGSVSTETELKDKIKESGHYEYHIRAYGERGNIVVSDTVKIEIEIKK